MTIIEGKGSLMSPEERSYYDSYRKKGYSASEAIRCAKVRAAFDLAAEQGLVRVQCEPEWELFSDDMVYGEGATDAQKKATDARIDREGYWVMATQYRHTVDDDWETAESLGSFIGQEWYDSGYDIEMMQSALDKLDKSYQDEANEIANRATYASVL